MKNAITKTPAPTPCERDSIREHSTVGLIGR